MFLFFSPVECQAIRRWLFETHLPVKPATFLSVMTMLCYLVFIPFIIGAGMIAWFIDLQLPVQPVPITTKFIKFESCSWRGVLDTTLCNKVCQWFATGPWFSPGTPVSSANKTDRHDITEILLKALNTIILDLLLWK